MPYTEERLAVFNKEFVRDCGPSIEPVFIDAVGSVGPIRQFLAESIQEAVAAERERMRGRIENAIKYTDWSHSVGSHSDDRGGDSDIECTCREVEARYKTEAYKNVLSFLTPTPTDTTK